MTLTESLRTIKEIVSIPQYNLPHIGSVCHFNVCINLLSAMIVLLREMERVSTTSNDISFQMLKQYLINSFSEVDTNPNLLRELMVSMSLNPSTVQEAPDTMKRLLKIIYNNGISKNLVYYWDSTNDFVTDEEKKLSIHQLVCKYRPLYLLVNVQEFNTVMAIQNPLIEVLSFSIQKFLYTLKGVVVRPPGHFYSAFRTDSKHYEIRDDLLSRNSKITAADPDDHYHGFGGKQEYNYIHALALYVRTPKVSSLVSTNPGVSSSAFGIDDFDRFL